MKPNLLPPNQKKLEKIIGHHENQHTESEKGDIGEKPVITRIIFHVTYRVNMHHTRDKRNYSHHDDCQSIYQKSYLKLKFSRSNPGI